MPNYSARAIRSNFTVFGTFIPITIITEMYVHGERISSVDSVSGCPYYTINYHTVQRWHDYCLYGITTQSKSIASTPIGTSMTFKQRFTKFAHWTAHASGQPITFILAILIVVGWVLTGPIFNYSDTWQLVINTGTTVVTFLMVFLIQNTQNRDTGAIQVKLDELVRALKGARNELIDLENIDEEDLERIRKEYEKIAEKARQLQSRKSIKPKD